MIKIRHVKQTFLPIELTSCSSGVAVYLHREGPRFKPWVGYRLS
jgi:hypothetical protein